MTKFQTNVAGVSYYTVDFHSIKQSSRVDIVPEPDCPYDDCALRVEIDRIHVGYLKKGFNKTIWNEIKCGSTVTARVQAVVGGNKYTNHGIVLNLVIDDHTNSRSTNNLEPSTRPPLSTIEVFRSYSSFTKQRTTDDTWLDFLQKEKGLPALVELPREPDYKRDYDRDVPWVTRLWCESFKTYVTRRLRDWAATCAAPEAQNERRSIILAEFNATRSALESEYQEYIHRLNLQQFLLKIKASTSSKSSVRSNPPSIYEDLMYHMLKKRVKNTYQQVMIDYSSIDILCLSDDLSSAWAIEIDNGGNRGKTKADRDTRIQRSLNKLGVSLIRIPNSMITNSVEKSGNQILKIIGD